MDIHIYSKVSHMKANLIYYLYSAVCMKMQRHILQNSSYMKNAYRLYLFLEIMVSEHTVS